MRHFHRCHVLDDDDLDREEAENGDDEEEMKNRTEALDPRVLSSVAVFLRR